MNAGKWMGPALAVVFAFGAAGCKGGGGNEIRIGLAAPLTGDIAAMGVGMRNAAQMAVDEANQRADVQAKGVAFQLVPVDDRADPKDAVNVANQLVSDANVYAVIGHLNSGCSIPASKIYAGRNLLMITPASTNPLLTKAVENGVPKRKFKNTFRLCFTDEMQGAALADYSHSRGFRKVAVLHDKTAYGQGLAEEYRKGFEGKGGEILDFQGLSDKDTDFNAVLTKLKGLNPEALFFGGMYSQGAKISMQAKNLGLNAPLMGGDGMKSDEYIKIGGRSVEGDLVSAIGNSERMPKAREFREKYAKLHPNVDQQDYDAYTYDATNLAIEAILAVGTDRQKLIDYVQKIEFDGIIGVTSFDGFGDTTNTAISILEVRDGAFQRKN